jgi:hypothetical protein
VLALQRMLEHKSAKVALDTCRLICDDLDAVAVRSMGNIHAK